MLMCTSLVKTKKEGEGMFGCSEREKERLECGDERSDLMDCLRLL